MVGRLIPHIQWCRHTRRDLGRATLKGFFGGFYDCAENGTPTPEWAAKAFCDRLSRVAQCELSWEEAFGKVPADGTKRSTIQKLSKNLLKVGEAVQAYKGPKDETMRAALSNKLGLYRGKLIEYWSRYKRAHRS